MDRYQIIRQLGKGGGGIVYLAWDRNLGKYVALKQTTIATADLSFIRHELDVLKNLRHSYLPQVSNFFSMNGSYFLAEEYIEGEDLEHMLRRGRVFSEMELKRWLRQLCQVLNYLHTRHPPILHSDIKPANIMIDRQGDVCLIDFNIAINPSQMGKTMGFSQHFASPEQIALTKQGGSAKSALGPRLSSASDIYSLAATFYTLMTRRLPDQNYTPLEQQNGLPYSRELLRLLDRAMRPQMALRWQSARDMERALNQLEKQNARYRTYRLSRVLLNIAGMLLLSVGGFSLYHGLQIDLLSSYSTSYYQIERLYEQQGATAEVVDAIEQFIGNTRYTAIKKNRPIELAQVYAIEGEYYYQQDTAAGYENAAYYYQQAVELAEQEGSAGDYALNYALALALSGNTDLAQETVEQYLSGTAEVTVRAELYYYAQEDEQVLRLAREYASGTDTALVSLWEIASRSALRLEDWDQAIFWQRLAAQQSREDASQRKLAMVLMRSAAQRQLRENWEEARACLESLKNMTLEDQINCALTEYELGNSNASLSRLKTVEPELTVSSALSCRYQFYMALNYNQLNQMQQAERYCGQALKTLEQLSEQQRKQVDQEGLLALARSLGVS